MATINWENDDDPLDDLTGTLTIIIYVDIASNSKGEWSAYIGGELIGPFKTRDEAKNAAIEHAKYMKEG